MIDLCASYTLSSKEKENINDTLTYLEKDAKAIQQTTGIYEISKFNENIKIKDLFIMLLKNALKNNFKPNNIIVCTQTLDEAMPAISPQLVYLNKMDSINFCMDINAGCTGFVDLARVANLEISQNHNSYIFCFNGDINSKIVKKEDYALSCVFGDLVNLSIFKTSEDKDLGKDFYRYKVSLKNSLCIKRELNQKLIMKGMEVMTFVCDSVLPFLENYLQELEKTCNLEEFSLVLHQANYFIVNFINKKVSRKFPKIKTHEFCMHNIGNSGSSTIPYAIQDYFSKGELRGKVVICGYGVGLSVSIGVIKIGNNFGLKNSILEI